MPPPKRLLYIHMPAIVPNMPPNRLDMNPPPPPPIPPPPIPPPPIPPPPIPVRPRMRPMTSQAPRSTTPIRQTQPRIPPPPFMTFAPVLVVSCVRDDFGFSTAFVPINCSPAYSATFSNPTSCPCFWTSPDSVRDSRSAVTSSSVIRSHFFSPNSRFARICSLATTRILFGFVATSTKIPFTPSARASSRVHSSMNRS